MGLSQLVEEPVTARRWTPGPNLSLAREKTRRVACLCVSYYYPRSAAFEPAFYPVGVEP